MDNTFRLSTRLAIIIDDVFMVFVGARPPDNRQFRVKPPDHTCPGRVHYVRNMFGAAFTVQHLYVRPQNHHHDKTTNKRVSRLVIYISFVPGVTLVCPPGTHSPLIFTVGTRGVDVIVGVVVASTLRLVLLLAVLRIHQGVPLSNGTARRGQHIGPVTQLGAGGRVAEHHFADRLRCSDAIVINHGDDQLHFLNVALLVVLLGANKENASTTPQDTAQFGRGETAHATRTMDYGVDVGWLFFFRVWGLW